jgi:hypothetical protein
MSVEDFERLSGSIQALVTALSFIVGGFWVYRRYIRQQERYPNIEFSADINFIGTQENWWIVELIGTIENKGKAQHRMKEFNFDLKAIFPDDPIDTSEKLRGQVDFPHQVTEGSFLPHLQGGFFIDPGLKEKYSYITRVPKDATFLIFHTWFFSSNRDAIYTAEKTVSVPKIV